MKKFSVICFGEILWDIYPEEKFPGGAPFNVAFGLNQLGEPTGLISGVGQDELGDQILQFAKSKKVDDALIVRTNAPTGTVSVSLDSNGKPSYTINENVAYDLIPFNSNLEVSVSNSQALVYGSLACRAPISRKTLLRLTKLSKLNVLDLNLRSPFYDRALIESLLHSCHICKLNDEELIVLSKMFDLGGDEKSQFKKLMNTFNIETIVMTLGPDGSMAFDGSNYFRADAETITPIDTVGAGDAFLAGFLFKYVQRENLENCLQFGNKVGAYVATQPGATPIYDARLFAIGK